MISRGRRPLLVFLILGLLPYAFSLPEKGNGSPQLEERGHLHDPRQLFGLPWGLFNSHETDDTPAAFPPFPPATQTDVTGISMPDGFRPEAQLTTPELPATPQGPDPISPTSLGESLTLSVPPEEPPTEGPPVPDGGYSPTAHISSHTSLIIETDTGASPSTVVVDQAPSLPSGVTQVPPASSLVNGDQPGSLSEIVHSVTIRPSSVESSIVSNLNPQTQTVSTLWPTGSTLASTDAAGAPDPAEETSVDASQNPGDTLELPLSPATSQAATLSSDPSQQSTTTITPTASATSVEDPGRSLTDLTVPQPPTPTTRVGEITLWPTAQTQQSVDDGSTHTVTATSSEPIESPAQGETAPQEQPSQQGQTPAQGQTTAQGEITPQGQPSPQGQTPAQGETAPQGEAVPQQTAPQQETLQGEAAGPVVSAAALEGDGENAEAANGPPSPVAARSGGLLPAGTAPGPCPACPTPTCPGNPRPTPAPTQLDPRQGPCPGRGYSCPDCLDGWFCPPEHTPIQKAPCGYGWPCYHCSGGWYCAPAPATQPPCGSPSTVTATVTATLVQGASSNDEGSCSGADCPPGPGGNGNNDGSCSGANCPQEPDGNGNNNGGSCSGPNCPQGPARNGNNDDGSCSGPNCPQGPGGNGNNNGNDDCPDGNCPVRGDGGNSNGTPDSYGGKQPDGDDNGLTARAAPEAGGWKYLGCFNDTPGRTIDCDPNDWYAGNMTNAKCVAYCNKKGYKLAGTEYSRECWCGNVFQNAKRLPEIQCHMVCDGNSTDVCGGDWALTVYSRDGTAANTITEDDDHEGNVGGKQARDIAKAQGYGDGDGKDAASKPSSTPTTIFLTLATSAESRPTTFFTAAEPSTGTATSDGGVHILSAIQSMLEAIPSDLGFGEGWDQGQDNEAHEPHTTGQRHDGSPLAKRSHLHDQGDEAVHGRSESTAARSQRLTKEWRA